MKTTKKLCSLLLIAVLPLAAACSNTAKQEEEETVNNLLLLSLLSASTRASTTVATSTCATSTAGATSITATGTTTSTFVLASRGICYLKFTAPSSTNFTVQLTSVLGDTDLAVGNVGATATYGLTPSSFWPNGACGAYSWNTCVSTSSTPESVNNIPMTAAQQIGIGVYGYSCTSSTGCQFRVIVN